MNWPKVGLFLGCSLCCRESAPDMHFEYVEPKVLTIRTMAVPTADNTAAVGLAHDTQAVRKDLRAMECFIEHELRLELGEAPARWKQPKFLSYENHPGDPCSLMPER